MFTRAPRRDHPVALYIQRMHRNPLRSSATSLASGAIMSIGGLLYLADQIQKPRNWHLFLIPSLFLMAIGVLLALANAIAKRRCA